jgi:endogenous inhibitor of DNA gyrase (YacG/DUF329 family)
MSHCPICRKAAPARPLNPSSPFCSERCRQVDLGKWLNEEYAVPAEESDASDEGFDVERKDAS